jgi:hypothetical protein
MKTFFHQQRRMLAASLLGVVVAAGSLFARPGFVEEGLYSPNAAAITAVVPALDADVVILGGGLAQGIRLGMVCRVTRGSKEIGELVVIESHRDRAAALILNLIPDNVIQTGDVARVKTIQNS